MEIFKGWYRKSFARKDMVWHRVNRVDSLLDNRQMAYTVCGRRIPTTRCDFDIKPDHRCRQCEKSPDIIIPTGRGFVPVSATSIRTRSAAIAEMKRLIKPRIYYLRIWEHEGVCITAKWEPDAYELAGTQSVSIDPEFEIITRKRTRRVMTLEQIQADLGRFKSAIDCLCDAIDALALAAKRNKKLKGRLTEDESMNYFEKLLREEEK